MTPTFYLLPNVHKSLTNPPGRPIVSGIRGLCEKVWVYLDFYLQPFALHLQLYTQDSFHLDEKLDSTTFPMGTIVISLNVESLYTNIDHQVGVSAVTYFLDQQISSNHMHDFLIVDLLGFHLKHNYFTFDK